MKILVNNQVETLSLIDPNTGCDWVNDFIGNAGGFNQFVWNDELDVFICTEEDFYWWKNIIEQQQSLSEKIYSYSKKYGYDAVMNVINDYDVEFEDYAAIICDALDEVFSE